MRGSFRRAPLRPGPVIETDAAVLDVVNVIHDDNDCGRGTTVTTKTLVAVGDTGPVSRARSGY